MAKIDEVINTLTPEELQALNNDPQMLAEFKAKYGQEKQSLLKQAWDALAVPEQKSKEGLDAIAQAIPKNIGSSSGEPSGNLVRDVAAGTPRILADTLAETAPGFVSRGALLTSGAFRIAGEAAPLAKAVMRGAGTQAESLSGAAPGALEAAYQDAGTMFSKGKKAVQGVYQAAKGADEINPELIKAGADSKNAFILKAKELADAGKLNPTEALEARKELIRMKKSLPDVTFRSMQNAFDDIAKQSFSGADEAHQAAIKGESLRNLLPQNKYGGASAFKMAVGEVMMHLPGGKLAMMALSPAAMGTAATGAGLVGRYGVSPVVNAAPQTQMALSAILQNLNRMRKSSK